EREDMVESTDNWFRPSDVCVAPDGSVYVADWYDPGVGGHGMGDTTRGRVYRIAPKNVKPSVPKVELTTAKGVLAALDSPCLSVRSMAMAKIIKGNVDAKENVDGHLGTIALDKKAKPSLRARALWLIMGHGSKKPGDWAGRLAVGGIFSYVLTDPDPRIRCLG